MVVEAAVAEEVVLAAVVAVVAVAAAVTAVVAVVAVDVATKNNTLRKSDIYHC